ncbi:NUDIX domain-containing protein [Phaeacidiphilus oryzae]|uniref:NUDIX domain-containing protein n=1 Tax=Phaeacidiphilus oryzae TaxID=348818 RepID=UPI000690217F|nr:NUDIX hydrolase [Phaeacidiphilus oryzae]
MQPSETETATETESAGADAGRSAGGSEAESGTATGLPPGARPRPNGVLASSSVLIPDREGRVLCVRLTYGPHRIALPGGGQDPGESPRETAARECREEIGVTPRLRELAAVDWSAAPGRPPIATTVYWAEPLTAAEEGRLVLQPREIAACGHLTAEEVRAAATPRIARRITACLAAGPGAGPLELVNGHLADHSAAALPAGPPPADPPGRTPPPLSGPRSPSRWPRRSPRPCCSRSRRTSPPAPGSWSRRGR